MEWLDVETSIRSELSRRNLRQPRLRLSALDTMERLLEQCFPVFRANPKILVDIGKSQVSKQLGLLKGNLKLNGADKAFLTKSSRN
jgi:hypothetical protein